MERPLVSIIIPTYNRAQLIGETLDSVLAQSYPHWECIVVDDGSTDHTGQVLKYYSERDDRIVYYSRPESYLPGGNGARNYGFDLAKGDYIQWFDSDDVMLSNCLEYKLLSFGEMSQFVISAGAYLFENGEIKRFGTNVSDNLYKEYVLWKTSIFTPSILFKRSFLLRSQIRFNELLFKGQETDFLGSLFYGNKDVRFEVLDEVLFYYRRHSFTKSFESEKYISKFKWSNAYNHTKNLQRAIALEDGELVSYFFKKCVKLYYSAINNNDKTTYFYLYKELKRLMSIRNCHIVLKLKVLLFVNHRYSDKLFNHLRNVKVKF